jgi:PKD repeat protein
MVVHGRFFSLLFSLFFCCVLTTAGNLWAGEIRFVWQAPTTNEDGTTLTDLNRYKIHYGPVSRETKSAPATFQYQSAVTISSSQTSHTLTGLTTGQRYYLSVTALDTTGNKSKFSNEVSAVAQNSGATTSTPSPPPPPIAAFKATPQTGTLPLAVTFTDTSSGTITSRSWTFGNDASSSAVQPSYTYTTYPVTLTVTGPGGTHSATTIPATVNTASISAVGTMAVAVAIATRCLRHSLVT